jgi:hypothetical protein
MKMNKLVRKAIEDFLIRENAGSITSNAGSVTVHLFAFIDDKKHVVGWLNKKGLDPFKRGTKMPELITNELASVKWSEVKQSPMLGVSMWD